VGPSRSGRYGEVKILDPAGTRNSYLSVIQPLATAVHLLNNFLWTQRTHTSYSRIWDGVLGSMQRIQIRALDRVQNKAAKFAHHTGGPIWEPLAQRRKTARMCALYKAYNGERT
jgi:hypothetical protein